MSAGIPSAWQGRGSDWLAQDQVCPQDETVIPGTKGRRQRGGKKSERALEQERHIVTFPRKARQSRVLRLCNSKTHGPLPWLAGSIADPALAFGIAKIASRQSEANYIYMSSSCNLESKTHRTTRRASFTKRIRLSHLHQGDGWDRLLFS